MIELPMAALSFERRVVALALFRELHLDNMVILQLPTDTEAALNRLVGFINREILVHRIKFLAVLAPPSRLGDRIVEMHSAATAAIRAGQVPSVEVPEEHLLEAYAHPGLTRRAQLRAVGRTIWPSLNDAQATNAAVDAAILGLHVQTERLFKLYEEAI
jgi:hypothetical protein